MQVRGVADISGGAQSRALDYTCIYGLNGGGYTIELCLMLPLCMYMCSEVKGAAAVVIQEAPMALYFHCMLHNFNLCASQAIKVSSIRNCLDLVREIIWFFSFSAPRNHALQQAVKDIRGEYKHLKKLCDTRFVEKHSAILTCLQLLPSVHLTFERLSQSDSRETRQQAAQLLASIEKFEFLVNLQALAETSGVLIGVSRSLQAVGIDFVTGFNDVMTVKEVLKAMRQKPEESFVSVFQAAEKLAELSG